MAKKLLLPVFFLLLFFSCKKESNTGTSTSGNGGGSSQPGTYDGLLYFFSYNGTANQALAVFFTPAQPFPVPSGYTYTMTAVDSVFVNGQGLAYDSLDPSYSSTGTLSVPCTWKVKGKGIFPSFTYTNNDSMPGYTGFNLWPDTLHQSQNLVVQLTGLKYWDEFLVQISDGPGNTIYQVINKGATSVTFPKDSLAKLSGLNVSLDINVLKLNPQVISSRKFLFCNDAEFQKVIPLKP